LSGITLLCLVILGNTFLVGAFGPVLPDIARTGGLADWQLGVVAGAFGFARMAGAMPAGFIAARHVALSLVLSPVFLSIGLACVTVGGSFGWLVFGRALMGVGHTLLMVGGLTAILLDDKGAGASLRLNTFVIAARRERARGTGDPAPLSADATARAGGRERLRRRRKAARRPRLLAHARGGYHHGLRLVVGQPVPRPAPGHA
jgi:hypothetical protein